MGRAGDAVSWMGVAFIQAKRKTSGIQPRTSCSSSAPIWFESGEELDGRRTGEIFSTPGSEQFAAAR